MAALPSSIRHLHARADGGAGPAATGLVPVVCLVRPVPTSHVLSQDRRDAQVLLPIEENFAIDKRRIDARVNAEWMCIPDRDVGVFADFDRADSILNAELNRRIERDKFQRLFFSEIAPVHRFRCFDVQPAGAFVGVGVHRNNHTRARHDRGVVRNRVVSFDLVGPRVGKDRSAGSVRGDLFRDLVALEHVLESLDLETKLIGEIDQHQDLARDVAVRVNVAFAFEDLDERLELKISPRRNQIFLLSLLLHDIHPTFACNHARA